VTIRADNAYLPTNVAAAFGTLSNGFNAATGASGTAAAPAQAIVIGTQNLNNIAPDSYSIHDLCMTVGLPCNDNHRALMRGVFSLEGRLNDDWSWKGYVQHSGVRERQVLHNNSLTPRYNFAADAVQVTAANQGSSRPCDRQQSSAAPAARAMLPAAGCQPLNVLGTGVASDAALLYINPGRDPNSGILGQ
jgi:hypothetical protein